MLNISKLTLIIKGKKILDDVSLNITDNQIIGLVGPNGSGKSSLFKCISSLYINYEGTISYTGKLAFMIENSAFYEYLSGYDNLLILSIIYHVNKDTIKKTIDIFKANDFIYKSVKNYSMGMKQKLYLISIFMQEASVILLDEPTNALDTISIINLRNYLKEFKDKIIIYSSHTLSELNKVCDEIVYIKNGKIIERTKNKKALEKRFMEVYCDN